MRGSFSPSRPISSDLVALKIDLVSEHDVQSTACAGLRNRNATINSGWISCLSKVAFHSTVQY